MSQTHVLKLNSCYIHPILTGEKLFEVRYNDDRGFQKGDLVRFRIEFLDNASVDDKRKIESITYEITYVLVSFNGLADGYVAFGIRPLNSTDGSVE